MAVDTCHMYSYEAEIANRIIIMISKWKNPLVSKVFKKKYSNVVRVEHEGKSCIYQDFIGSLPDWIDMLVYQVSGMGLSGDNIAGFISFTLNRMISRKLYNKAEKQYLLTCKVNRYCLLALHGTAANQSDLNYRAWLDVIKKSRSRTNVS